MDIKTTKMINAILFFANKEKDKSINRLKLLKLLWLSDRLHLNRYARLILPDTYHALPHGPVASQVKEITDKGFDGYIKSVGYDVTSLSDFNSRFFSKSDINVMQLIWDKFGATDKYDLRDYSHIFPEWTRFEKDLNDKSRPNNYQMVMDDFFELPNDETYNELVADYNLELSRSEFRESKHLEEILKNA